MLLQAAKFVGARLGINGLAGAGVGICSTVFGALVIGISRNVFLSKMRFFNK
jgi:hypothetical protein